MDEKEIKTKEIAFVICDVIENEFNSFFGSERFFSLHKIYSSNAHFTQNMFIFIKQSCYAVRFLNLNAYVIM